MGRITFKCTLTEAEAPEKNDTSKQLECYVSMKLNPMEISIRKYQPSDITCIVKFMEGSQDYLASIDNMKRIRRMPDYGESHTRLLLENGKKRWKRICRHHT
jgi:hypothetical protein